MPESTLYTFYYIALKGMLLHKTCSLQLCIFGHDTCILLCTVPMQMKYAVMFPAVTSTLQYTHLTIHVLSTTWSNTFDLLNLYMHKTFVKPCVRHRTVYYMYHYTYTGFMCA
jgi:hypothetical protein